MDNVFSGLNGKLFFSDVIVNCILYIKRLALSVKKWGVVLNKMEQHAQRQRGIQKVLVKLSYLSA